MDNAAKLTGALAILLFMCGFAIAPSVAEDNQVLQGSIFKPSRTGAHSSDPRSQFRYFDSYQVPKPFSRVPVKDVFVAKKKFDLRNGDELKLQLAEEFRISWPG